MHLKPCAFLFSFRKQMERMKYNKLSWLFCALIRTENPTFRGWSRVASVVAPFLVCSDITGNVNDHHGIVCLENLTVFPLKILFTLLYRTNSGEIWCLSNDKRIVWRTEKMRKTQSKWDTEKRKDKRNSKKSVGWDLGWMLLSIRNENRLQRVKH